MKKTFLSLVFAITMGASLFAGTLKGTNSAYEPSTSTAAANDNQISLVTTGTHEFAGASSVLITEGSSVKVDGNKITAIDVGTSTVSVDGTPYIVNVTLPSNYLQLDYIKFQKGANFDTGVIFNCNSLKIKFNYEGTLPSLSFGYESGSLLGPGGNFFIVGDRDHTLGSTLSADKTEKTLFNFILDGSNACLTIGDEYDSIDDAPTITNFKSQKFCFGRNINHWSDPIGIFEGKLFDLYLEQNGIPVRNYIPCRNNSTYALGLIDTYTNTFITSFKDTQAVYNEFVEEIGVNYHHSNGTVVNPLNSMLYLGGDFDFEDTNGELVFDNGVYITGDVANAYLNTSNSSLNLTTLFGVMSPGTIYNIVLHKGNIIERLQIIKSDIIYTPDLYIECNKSLKELHTSKDVVGTGSFVFNDSNSSKSGTFSKLKGRGNHYNSDEAYKNSYNLTIDAKEELIPGVSHKKYCLIGLTADSHYLINQVGLSLYQYICKNGDAINYRMINLYYNGLPRGLYMLTEKVDINKDVIDITEPKYNVKGTNFKYVSSTEPATIVTDEERELLSEGITRFNYCMDSVVSSDGGYILEAGLYFGTANGGAGFTTSYGNSWEIKEPSNPSFEQVKKIALYMDKAEEALFSSIGFNENNERYSELFDLDSIAREFLVRSFMLDCDFYITSNFLYIDGDNSGLKGKLYAGCVWDFDYDNMRLNHNSVYDNTNNYVGAKYFREKLMEKGDFVSMLNDINDNEFNNILTDLFDEKINPKSIYKLGQDILASRTMDYMIYGKPYNLAGDLFKKGGSAYTKYLTRKSSWNTIWSDETNALRGVHIEKGPNDSLVATSNGASSYQWYKINELTKLGEPIANATSSSFTPEDDSQYYVMVTGKSLAGVNHSTMTSNVLSLGKSEVTFDMQGHGSQVIQQNIVNGYFVNKVNVPYESGYIFKGWYKEPECINRWIFSTDVVTENTTLYAKWVEGGTLFAGTSISLCDNTWINMYTDLIDDDYQDYAFTYQIRDGSEVDLDSSMIKKISGKWRISVALLPYQLADVITVRMYDLSDHLICTKADSVRAYGKRLLDNSTSQAEKDAMQALLDYGAAVQKLKGYHVDDLANDFSKLAA